MTASAAALLLAMGTVPADAARDHGYDSLNRHTGPYATGFIGGALGGEVDDGLDFDLDSGWLFGGTLGFDNLFAGSGGDFRAEVEISHRSQDFENFFDEADLTTLLGNLWYDFGTGGALIPYAGGGLGIGFYEDNFDEATGFAYQFGGGVNYHMSHRTMLGLNYRYLLADMDIDNAPGEIEYSGSQLSVSLGYKF